MTLATPIEFAEPPSLKSSLPLSPTNSPPSSVREGRAQSTLSEQFPPTTSTRNGRPLPEVPEYLQSRPLPPRPTGVTAIHCLQDFSNNPLAALRPVSDSGPLARNKYVEEKRPKLDPIPQDTPAFRPSSPLIISPPAASPRPDTFSHPPTVTAPVVFSVTPKPNYPASILPDLLSPTTIDLFTAAGLTVTGENGEQILFGSLFRDRKVIIIFIRHFWCPFCQDYVRSIFNSVTPGILGQRGVDLVLIGNGAPGMIKAYKSTPWVAFHLRYNQRS